MKDKKIICFDNWTRGAHHFSRLQKSFKKFGYKLILIHIGSWGHDKDRPKEELINSMLVRDISYYNHCSFFEILKKEKPHAVLFLSIRSPAFMAFNRCANYLKIPTCHIYHGVVNVQKFIKGDLEHKNSLFMRKKIFSRLYSIFLKLIPVYIFSLIKTKANLSVWLEFLTELFNKLLSLKLKKKYLFDTKTSIGCVYTYLDAKHMKLNYGLKFKQIYIVGNPDFIKFDLKYSDLGLMTNNKNKKKIIYIETGFLDRGIAYKSIENFINHIYETKIAVENLGYKFLIKLKPHSISAKKEIISMLKSKDIDICDNKNFLNQLKNSRAVITEPTSAALLPAALGLPLLLASYGELSNLNYGIILKSYPRSSRLRSLKSLSKQLKLNNLNSKKKGFFKIWLKKNIAPFDFKKMPDRVAKAVYSIIK